MPIKIPDALPAAEVLQRENIFTIESSQAEIQDIRALRILILNLMPKKNRDGNSSLKDAIQHAFTSTN